MPQQEPSPCSSSAHAICWQSPQSCHLRPQNPSSSVLLPFEQLDFLVLASFSRPLLALLLEKNRSFHSLAPSCSKYCLRVVSPHHLYLVASDFCSDPFFEKQNFSSRESKRVEEMVGTCVFLSGFGALSLDLKELIGTCLFWAGSGVLSRGPVGGLWAETCFFWAGSGVLSRAPVGGLWAETGFFWAGSGVLSRAQVDGFRGLVESLLVGPSEMGRALIGVFFLGEIIGSWFRAVEFVLEDCGNNKE
ncbi:S-layer protein / Peptidoglycanendo-beta-N-acetylglucosaminidase [Striga asiatica]|uniref:S-layer protein / Peptidoglycanendo-beta-N-acetylglucosaminidase n=1 Tax=Striga asiatica TaxID=4170 RepID=A0A5A7P6Q1_STRAF|nr:S-layer protein / Peptidoglycanendo-beta-N-acetylglucosaminidase [Striga asiatica]